MDNEEKIYVSPRNGQPVPHGNRFTSETAREAARKSHQVQAEKKSIALEFRKKINQKFKDENGTEMTGAEIVAQSIIKGANNGNARMVEIALALLGEKPAEKIVFAEVEQSVIDEVERAVYNDETDGY